MDMHKPSSSRDYMIALLIASALTVFLGCYHFIRRGYLFDAPSTADTLYVPNKVIANAGMMILAFTFLISPIIRYFDRFDTWLGYRKEIGIVGGFLAIFHGIVSYFYLPIKYPQSYIDFASWEFAAGLIGAFILIFLFIISFKKAIVLLGGSRWWFLQRFGLRIVILLTLIHIFALKWHSWINWLSIGATQSTELMRPLLVPASLISGFFITWVVIIRLYEPLLTVFRHSGSDPEDKVLYEVKIKASGRRFFIGSFWILVIIYFFVFTRWLW